MNAATLAGVALAAVSQSPVSGGLALSDAAQAIDAGRFDQARLMIAQAVKAGATGTRLERLLADLAFASGNNAEALARYRQLADEASPDSTICGNAAIAALRIGATKEASATIDCATTGPNVTWRSWNARGVLADIRRDWPEADSAYQKAARLMPAEPSVLNNQGWSFVLRGNWTEALQCFRRAVQLDPMSMRIADNLELTEAALSEGLPGRRAGETDRSWAARLNDAGVAAQLIGDRKRAIAAFTQALEASGPWYSLARNNLEAAARQ